MGIATSPRRSRTISSTRGSVEPAASARLAGPLDHRAVRDGVRERHAQLDDVGALARRLDDELAR